MNILRLKELLEIPYELLEMNKEYKTELTEYYSFIYGAKGCSSCKDKFKTYYKKLSETGVELLTNKTTSNFKLRTNLGVSKISFEDGSYITQSYAPDEICIEFLKANPSRISLFESYPDNWTDLINDNENETTNE